MRKLLFTAAALLVVSAAPSSAREYAWCAANAVNSSNPQCDFSTYQQCQATISGQGGTCSRNPALADSAMSGHAPANGWGASSYR
jgi:hypothetical protein